MNRRSSTGNGTTRRRGRSGPITVGRHIVTRASVGLPNADRQS